jgi:hypothetical protein
MGEVERNVEGSNSRHALGRNKSREDRLDEARAVKLGKLLSHRLFLRRDKTALASFGALYALSRVDFPAHDRYILTTTLN